MMIALALCPFGKLSLAVEEFQEIRYTTTADNLEQPARFYAPETDKAVPLLVVLHTWSVDYLQDLHF